MPKDLSAFPYVRVPATRFPNDVYFYSVWTDFPTPSGNVITLPSSGTIVILGSIDLNGNRLVASGPVAIIGFSQTSCELKSTGLPTGQSLITSSYQTSMYTIKLSAPSDANILNISNCDGIDFFKVQFAGGRFGTINSVGSTVFEGCGVTGITNGLSITGTINSFAMNNTLINSATQSGAYFTFESTLTVNLRVRFVYCSFVVYTAGINFVSTNIPNNRMIIKDCNFSGAGTYLQNITSNNIRSDFLFNVGITNSSAEGVIRITDNASATTIAAANTFYAIVGTNTVPVSNRFTSLGSVSFRYDGARSQTFHIGLESTLLSGNNQKISLTFSINGSGQNTYKKSITTPGTGDNVFLAVSGTTTLNTNDVVQAWVENQTSTSSVTITDLTFFIFAIN